VAKSGSKGSVGEIQRSVTTRGRIVDAAIETLTREGFAGASARAIAKTGGFSQALIFYYFGTVNDLLLAALDETSARRMERYRPLVDRAGDLSGLIDAAAKIYREDLASGHIKVLAELIAGSSAVPELGPEVAARIEPWAAFARGVIDRILGSLPLAGLLPSEDLAFAIVSLYLGMELLTHLQAQTAQAERLFRTAKSVAGLVASLGAQ
jgi:AcrR family transcriptional regulator